MVSISNTSNIQATIAVSINSISTLRTLNPQYSNQIITIDGYSSSNKEGGGTFYWDPTSTETDNNGTIVQVTGITTGRWKRQYSGPVNVKWFGAKGDGIANDTFAIQSTINSLGSNGGKVYFPKGNYIINGIIIQEHGIILQGDCNGGTIVQFRPLTVNDIGIKYSRAIPAIITPLQNCGIKDIGMIGNGSETITNIMLEIIDVREFKWINCSIGAWNAIGIRTKGRDTSTFDKVLISCSIPLYIAQDPLSPSGFGSVCDIDHFTFRDCYFTGQNAGATYYLIEIDTGLQINKLIFDGRQAWVNGAGGLKWIDNTASYVSTNWNISNVRYERSNLVTDGYIFYINKGGGITLNSSIFNCIHGGNYADYHGFYLRGCLSTTIQAFQFNGNSSSNWLDIDDSVRWLKTINCISALDSNLILNDTSCIIQDNSNGSGIGTNSYIDTINPVLILGIDQGIRKYGEFEWHWEGVLADDAQIQLPISTNRVIVWADITCQPGNYNGIPAMSLVETAAGANIINYIGDCAITDTLGKLCYIANGGELDPYVKNRLGTSQNLLIQVRWKKTLYDGYANNLLYNYDYNMELDGYNNWTALRSATLSKQDGYHTGSHCLRIAYNGVNYPTAVPKYVPLIIGTTYDFNGYARSDGSAIPRVQDSGSAILWIGTNSTYWQKIDVTFTAQTTTLELWAAATSAGYCEYDDLELLIV